MPQDHDTHDQQLEEIVAYLDGELSSEESARVERRLASDEAYRQQLQGIDRAWHALDDLPMATVDDRFSRTTLTRPRISKPGREPCRSSGGVAGWPRCLAPPRRPRWDLSSFAWHGPTRT